MYKIFISFFGHIAISNILDICIAISGQLNKFGLLLLKIHNYVNLSSFFNYLKIFVSINIL